MSQPDLRARLAGPEPVPVVAFRLGGELYGCDVLLIQEVVTRRPVHPLPDMPGHLLGVIRLRGELVPVVDVAPLLDVVRREAAGRAVLVVEEEEAGTVGVAADGVEEVVELPPDTVRPAPTTRTERDGYLIGVVRTEYGLLTLIDLAEMIRDQTTLAHGGTA